MAKSNRTQPAAQRYASTSMDSPAISSDEPSTIPMAPQPPTHEEDPFLTPAEVARQLGMSPQTIGRWIQDGLINATFFPNERWKVRKSEVNRLLRGSCLNKQVV